MNTWELKLNNKAYQCKALKADAQALASRIRAVLNISSYVRELYGTIGVDENTSVMQHLFGKSDGVMLNPDKYAADRDALLASLPEIITAKDIPDILARCKAIMEEHMPVKDSRRTPEEANEAQRKIKEAEDAREAARFTWIDAHCKDREKVQIPAGMMSVYLEWNYDDSDSMTDYFDRHHGHGENMLLAIVKKQPQTEKLARSIVALYPELEALSWTWHKENYSMGHGNWLQSGVVGNIEGNKTYGGYSNPPFWYEIQMDGYDRAMYAYKNYPGARPDKPAQADTASGPADCAGFTVEYERDWTWLKFPDKPAESIRETLKAMYGARFSGKRLAWYITRHVEQGEIEQALATA